MTSNSAWARLTMPKFTASRRMFRPSAHFALQLSVRACCRHLSCTIICPRTTRSLVFLAYDCLSERRQRKVLEAAVQSSRIVSNLFPSVVRDRLFRTEGSKKTTERSAAASQKLRLKTFLHHEGKVVDNNDEGEGKEAAPIAELFPDCTVCK